VRFRGLVLCGLTALSVGVLLPSHAGAETNSSSSGDGTVVELPKQLHNAFYDRYINTSQAPVVSSSETIVDNVNKRIFVYNPQAANSACPDIISYDADSLKPLATGCAPLTPTSHSPEPEVAVDSTDQLLMMPEQASGIGATGLIDVISEATLQVLGKISVPVDTNADTSAVNSAGENSFVGGITWIASSNDLLIVAGRTNSTGNDAAIGGVALYRFHVHPEPGSGGAQPTWGAFLWISSLPLNNCDYIIQSQFTSSAPALSGDGTAIYVPCIVTGFGGTLAPLTNTKSGVAKVVLGTTGLDGLPCPASANNSCPESVTSVTAPGPWSVTDFLFDSQTDRGYMFDSHSTSGVTAYVYDGKHQTFSDRTSLGSGGGAPDETRIGFEPVHGRLYAVNQENGLTLLDGRRTPLGSGTVLTEFAKPITYGDLQILEPDSTHAYPRFLVPYAPLQGWTVVEDRMPVSTDPPANVQDQNTYQGAIPPGSTVNESYGGAARGYGVHNIFVGSYGGFLNNAGNGGSAANGLPLGSSTPDTFAGVVSHLSIHGGVVSGQSSALMSDGSSEDTYGECTNLKQVDGACVNPLAPLSALPSGAPQPPCSSLQSCQGPCPLTSSPSATPTPTPSNSAVAAVESCEPPDTRQSWPAGTADCSYPSASSPDASTDGTVFLLPDGTPVALSAGSGSADPIAHAEIHCESASPLPNSATGSAYLQGIQVAGAASVSIARSASSGVVSPPGQDGSMNVESSAVAQGLHIAIPQTSTSDAFVLDIGVVSQTATATAGGVAGSASAVRSVVISDVAVNGKRMCDQAASSIPSSQAMTCYQALFDQINAQFPTALRIDLPQPDQSFGDMRSDGTIPGSPGGYTAVVQSTSSDQGNNAQFNEMRQPGEASFLPALRITILDDGSELNREVIDLAGVEADAELGLQVFPPWETQTPSNFVPQTTTITEQGPVMYQRLPGGGGVPAGPPTGNSGWPGPLGVLQQVFTGLQWLHRSPAAVIQMLATLWLLMSPLLVMRRRWSFAVKR